nr:hypothetical protein [uncultured Desulfuromusa sp.]
MYTEVHPFPEFIPANAKALIVGSFPPVKLSIKNLFSISGSNKKLYDEYFLNKRNQKSEKDIDYYYGSSNNMFWDLIGAAFNCEINTKDDMISFLTTKKIGITDLVEKCHRKETKRKPSRQNPNNVGVGSLDSDLSAIEFRDVIQSIKDHNIKKVYCTSRFVKKLLLELDESKILNNSNVQVVVLPSPSPASSRSIGREATYKALLKSGIVKNTKDYRIIRYKEIFKDMI